MTNINTPPLLDGQESLQITEGEAEVFVREVLKEELPPVYPASIEWINQLILAFHTRLPFQVLFSYTMNY